MIGDVAAALVDRLALEQRQRDERRRAAREEMQSSYSSPAEKVRAWERLHGLQLPHDPGHLVLRFVARQTGLSLETVLNEQRGRAPSRALASASLTRDLMEAPAAE